MEKNNVNFCENVKKACICRTDSAGEAINGKLHFDGQCICDTVENRLTALPAGDYRLVRHYCKQYARFMPVVVKAESGAWVQLETRCAQCEPREDVSLNTLMPCVCPMLKPGNGVHNRHDGSIILGTALVPGCLKHPLDTFYPLAERIRKAIKRKTVISLKIVEL